MEMIMDKFGTTNPVVGIPQYINTITDMLALSNIKNVGRYLQTPSNPRCCSRSPSTPKEPDAMTVAAKAQYEKVKSKPPRRWATANSASRRFYPSDAFRQEEAPAVPESSL